MYDRQPLVVVAGAWRAQLAHGFTRAESSSSVPRGYRHAAAAVHGGLTAATPPDHDGSVALLLDIVHVLVILSTRLVYI